MQDPTQYLLEVASRIMEATHRAYPSLHPDMVEPPGITDDDWVGMVAIEMCQSYGFKPSFALDTVTKNRAQIVAARQSGVDPTDIIDFMIEKLGPPPPSAFDTSHHGH